MSQRTPLYPCHVEAGARLVDFHGWEMPLHYGSQLEEHHQVRRDAGMFDVSHMTIVEVQGTQAQAFLRYMLANDVAKLKQPGKALYTGMLNEQGGVIDDLIVYFFSTEHYRLVVNSATHDKDLAWLNDHAEAFSVTLTERAELAMIAVQGPQARAKVHTLLSATDAERAQALKPFFGIACGDKFIATTGYTGEAGYEILVPAEQAVALWQDLLAAGVAPCGLGARDTLRLEAGMNLYGQDMDETVSPLAANMGWTIAWDPADRDFIGRAALTAQRANGTDKLVGLSMTSKGVLRSGQTVIITDDNHQEHQGIITSGSFSPTLGHAIALARIPQITVAKAEVEMRKKRVTVEVTKPVFVRQGKAVS